MLCRERGPEVNLLLHHHIFHGRRLKDTQHKYLIGYPEPEEGMEGFPPLHKGRQSPTPNSSPAASSQRSEGSKSEDPRPAIAVPALNPS